MEDNTYFNKIAAERKEYDLMLNKGMTFKVNVQNKKKKLIRKKILFFLPKYETIIDTEEKEFIIHQPVLKVLDRLSYEFLNLNINNKNIEDKNQFQHEAIKAVKENAITLAKIVAIAVLGLEYQNEKKFKYYTNLFLSSITPKKLFDLAIIINTMGNLVDFINSIRLMSGNRTATPNLIEKENKQD